MSDPAGWIGGRFAVTRLLGVGGSAAVYIADDMRRGRPVALKVLHPHLGADPAAREAFLAEARAAGSLGHPNIAAVHAAGLHQAGGMTMAWIALDLVDGGSLAERVARHGPLTPAGTVAVLDGVLAALSAAHDRGLVHRDVGPANVLLAGDEPEPRSEDVRLVDFGLADAVGRDTRVAGALSPDRPGVLGTAAYMSPEQARGLPVTPAADLYQVGALGFFLLTGRPPFPRERPEQVLLAHVTAPPPVPSALVPAAAVLDAVITWAMAKDPAHRPADADTLRAALAAALIAPSNPAPTGVSPPNPDSGTRAYGSVEPASALHYLDPEPAPDEVPARRPIGLGAVAGVLIIGAVAAALWGLSAAGGAPAALPTSTATASTTPVDAPVRADPRSPVTPDPGVSTAAATVVPVPGLFGDLTDAQALLTASGLTLGEVTRVPAAEPADRVLGQDPAVGTAVVPGTPVSLTLASGRNAVPVVAGGTLGAARTLVESAGFITSTDRADLTGTVLGSDPAAGSVLAVGSTVRLLVAAPDPTVAPTPQPSPSTPVSG